jgi:formate-dependent nitrite reductase membrane component NrfD
MPIVFLFSAIVSGIAAVLVIYMLASWIRQHPVEMPCLDTIAKFLFFAFIIDFTLEGLDLLHRTYEADESFKTLNFMVQTDLFNSQILMQIIFGGLVPIMMLAITLFLKLSESARKGIYIVVGMLTLMGIFAMRWNVVIGGQLFSKSFLGYTTYKMAFATREGLLPAIFLMILPLGILWGLLKLLPPWENPAPDHAGPQSSTEP